MNFSYLVLLIISIASVSLQSEYSVGNVWRAGGTLTDTSSGSAVDNEGNVYLTGTYQGTAYFNASTTLRTNSSSDVGMYLAKYSIHGDLLWVDSTGGSSPNSHAIAVNTDGVYIVGSYSGNATFGTSNLTSIGQTDVFLAKYSLNGAFMWVRSGGSRNTDEAVGIAVGNSTVVIVGYTQGNFSMGTFNSTLRNNTDGFLLKYTSSGDLIWGKSIAGSDRVQAKSVAVSSDESIFVTGAYDGQLSIDRFNITSSGGLDTFLAKFNSTGDLLWLQGTRSTSDDMGQVVVTEQEAVYVVGEYRSQLNISNIVLNHSGNTDIYIAKYSTNGTSLWAKRAGGLGLDSVSSASISSLGLYIGGSFSGNATFGNRTLQSVGGSDIFIAEYNSDGELIFVQQAGGSGDEKIAGVSGIANSTSLFISGTFSQNITFGNFSITSNGSSDIFMVRYDVLNSTVVPPEPSVAASSSPAIASSSEYSSTLVQSLIIPSASIDSSSPILSNSNESPLDSSFPEETEETVSSVISRSQSSVGTSSTQISVGQTNSASSSQESSIEETFPTMESQSSSHSTATASSTGSDSSSGTVSSVHSISKTTSTSNSPSASSSAEESSGLFLSSSPTPVIPTWEVSITLKVKYANTTLIHQSDVSAKYGDTPDSQITYIVTRATNGRFANVSNPSQSIFSFTQKNIRDGQIVFVHLLLASTPSISFRIRTNSSEFYLEDAKTILIVPLAVNQQLQVRQGDRIVLSYLSLNTTDLITPPANILFTVTFVRNGKFVLRINPDQELRNFTQSQVNEGLVVFLHDNSRSDALFSVQVTNGEELAVTRILRIPVDNSNTVDTLRRGRILGGVLGVVLGGGLLIIGVAALVTVLFIVAKKKGGITSLKDLELRGV